MPAICTITASAKQGLIKIEEPDVIAVLDLKNKRIQIKRTDNSQAITLELTTAKLTVKDIDKYAKLDLSGDGKIEVTDGTKTASLDLSGSGKIELANGTTTARMALDSSGEIELANATQTASLSLAGSGSVYLADATRSVDLDLADLPDGYSEIALREIAIPTDLIIDEGKLKLTTEKRVVVCSVVNGSGAHSTGLTTKNVVAPEDCPT